MDAVVPAAGRGTRLRPLTDERPKPLVTVAGQPLLAHVLDALVPVNPETIVIVVGYRGDAISDQFGSQYSDIPLRYVRQSDPKGLAHALQQASSVVDDPCVVCNGDNVLTTDLRYLAWTHQQTTAAGTVLVQSVSRTQAQTTGVVSTDADGRVTAVTEKPANPASTTVSAGAFAFDPIIFEACATIDPAVTGEYELSDAISWLVNQDYRIETLPLQGHRVNVNTRADLDRAHQLGR